MAETVGDLARVEDRKRRAARGRTPDPDHHARYGAVVEMFADLLNVVATPAGETWLLGERLFSGFPDPETYTVIFLDAESRVVAAADLTRLPSAWTLPSMPRA